MGKPVVKGTRITVEQILEKLAAGETFEEIVAAHPRLTVEAVRAALRSPPRRCGPNWSTRSSRSRNEGFCRREHRSAGRRRAAAAGSRSVFFAELEPGLGDESVFARSVAFGGVLLTADKDFGEMVFRQQRSPAGVLLVRLAGVKSRVKAAWGAEVIDNYGAALRGGFAVLSPGRLRLRGPS